MRRITRLFPVLLTLAACVFSTPAFGQLESLPATDKTSYSQPEKQQINEYLGPRLDQIGNGVFRLSDADSFNEHDVKAGGFNGHDGLPRASGDAAD